MFAVRGNVAINNRRFAEVVIESWSIPYKLDFSGWTVFGLHLVSSLHGMNYPLVLLTSEHNQLNCQKDDIYRSMNYSRIIRTFLWISGALVCPKKCQNLQLILRIFLWWEGGGGRERERGYQPYYNLIAIIHRKKL